MPKSPPQPVPVCVKRLEIAFLFPMIWEIGTRRSPPVRLVNFSEAPTRRSFRLSSGTPKPPITVKSLV